MCENIITGEYETCTYNVYSLWEGMILDEEQFCDIEYAWAYFSELESKYREEENTDNGEISVCLYEIYGGNIIGNTTI